ncbi:MAG: hypothetical protein ACI4MJ_06700 [Aristaeellaceae bacterium]
MKRLFPGRLAHTMAVLMTLLLTLTLFAAPLVWQAVRLMTDRQLHERVALDPAVTQAQMARITQAVEALAAEQSFAPSTVLELVTEDGVRAYNQEVIGWWMGLFQPDPVFAAPGWDPEPVQEAVRADALFQETVPATMRRTTARDQVAYPVAKAVQSAVLPLRSQLVTLAMPAVLAKVDAPRLLSLLEKAPLLLAGVSVLLAGLILLVMHRRLCKGGMYIGSAMAASGLLTLLLIGGIVLLDPCGMVAQASSLLAMQLGLLGQQLAWPLLAGALAELAVGAGLMALHQRRIGLLFAGRYAA